MAKKYYLEEGDVIFTTGAYLKWDGEKFTLESLSDSDDDFFDGKPLERDEKDKPYIEKEA